MPGGNGCGFTANGDRTKSVGLGGNGCGFTAMGDGAVVVLGADGAMAACVSVALGAGASPVLGSEEPAADGASAAEATGRAEPPGGRLMPAPEPNNEPK